MDLHLWSTDADENRAPPPDGAPEGWRWSSIPGQVREVQAALARFYQDAEWLDLAPGPVSRSDAQNFAVEGDAAGLYIPGIRVRLGAGMTFVDAQVIASSYVFPTTLVTVQFAEVPIGCDSARVHIAAGFLSAAFASTGMGAGQLPTYAQLPSLFTEIVSTGKMQADYDMNFSGPGTLPLTPAGYITLFGADNAKRFYLSVDLAYRVFPGFDGFADEVTILVIRTPTSGPSTGVFQTQMMGGHAASGTFTMHRTRVLPKVDLGIAAPGDVVYVLATGPTLNWHFHGEVLNPLHYTSYEVTRTLA